MLFTFSLPHKKGLLPLAPNAFRSLSLKSSRTPSSSLRSMSSFRFFTAASAVVPGFSSSSSFFFN